MFDKLGMETGNPGLRHGHPSMARPESLYVVETVPCPMLLASNTMCHMYCSEVLGIDINQQLLSDRLLLYVRVATPWKTP